MNWTAAAALALAALTHGSAGAAQARRTVGGGGAELLSTPPPPAAPALAPAVEPLPTPAPIAEPALTAAPPSAAAPAAPLPSPGALPSAAPPPAPDEPAANAASAQESPADNGDRDPMAWIGVGVKLGVAGVAKGTLSMPSEGRSLARGVDARRGLHLAIPLYFGGRGFAWTLEPYLSKSRINHGVKDANGVIVGAEDVDLTAYGAYTGPAYNIQLARAVYLTVGLGVKIAYVASDGFAYAFDGYIRAPLSATYYVADQLALVAELGLGYGLSIFGDKARMRIDPLTNITRTVPENPQLATAFAWDLSFGVRLP